MQLLIRQTLLIGFILLQNLLPPLYAQRSPDWLAGNDRGNRYEGTYTRKVNNPSIDLVSLTAYFEPYEFDKKQMLKVKFFSPGASNYLLKAEELTVYQYYWMQSKENQAASGWNQFDNWPVDYLLKRFSINSRNLGLLVQFEPDKSTRKFLPAFICHSDIAPIMKYYVLQLRLGKSILSGNYKVYQGELRRPENILTEGAISSKSGGTTFPVAISLSNLPDSNTWIFVEVNCKESGSLDPFAFSFQFYHANKK